MVRFDYEFIDYLKTTIYSLTVSSEKLWKIIVVRVWVSAKHRIPLNLDETKSRQYLQATNFCVTLK